MTIHIQHAAATAARQSTSPACAAWRGDGLYSFDYLGDCRVAWIEEHHWFDLSSDSRGERFATFAPEIFDLYVVAKVPEVLQ